MCCPNCFRDDFLKDFISRNAELQGRCDLCGSENVPLVVPARLAPYFESVLEGYTVRVEGQHLWVALQEDWKMFSPIVDARRAVEAILGPLAQATYVARESVAAPSSEVWSRLRLELQEENRFFPKNAPDRDLFRLLMENLASTDVPEIFFRARLMTEGRLYALDEMGAPSSQFASDGRANPIGIRYLYLADGAETAIAEAKPSKGATVAVARFRVIPDRHPKLIDLTNPKLTISPFRVTNNIADVRASMSFLQDLGEELSVPTQPHRATRDYLASQYLCELIKVSGYDGVIYRSSLGVGRNFTFFDVAMCAPEGVVMAYRVTNVEVSANQM